MYQELGPWRLQTACVFIILGFAELMFRVKVNWVVVGFGRSVNVCVVPSRSTADLDYIMVRSGVGVVDGDVDESASVDRAAGDAHDGWYVRLDDCGWGREGEEDEGDK